LNDWLISEAHDRTKCLLMCSRARFT